MNGGGPGRTTGRKGKRRARKSVVVAYQEGKTAKTVETGRQRRRENFKMISGGERLKKGLP